MSHSTIAKLMVACALAVVAPACSGAPGPDDNQEWQEADSTEQTEHAEAALTTNTRIDSSRCTTTVRLSGGHDEVLLDFSGAASSCEKYVVNVSVDTTRFHYRAVTTQLGGDIAGDRTPFEQICEGKVMDRRLSRFELGRANLVNARADRGDFVPAVGLPGSGGFSFRPERCENPTIARESILSSSEDYVIEARAREYSGARARVTMKFVRIAN